MDMYTKYDPNVIIAAANQKRDANDMSGAEMMFQSALLEWVDDAREGAVDPDFLREAIATLWLAYGEFHRTNKAWKSAVEIYEQAIKDPIAGNVARVWLEYAQFCEERGKMVTAQNIYLRALVGDGSTPPQVVDPLETDLLWNEFLEMMKKKTPSLTLASLKEAVQKEHVNKRAQPDSTSSTSEPVEKRQKTEEPMEESRTHVVTEDAVEMEKKSMIESTSEMAPEISAEWMARDGDAPPQAPEPPLFLPTRPKLTDPSGRDLVGDEIAVAVTERLLSPTGTVLLETCRALWVLSALKEKEQHKAIEALDKSMQEEHKKLLASHRERLSVATGAAQRAVEMVHMTELAGFEQSCSARRRQLLGEYAWKFRHILYVQQCILTKLEVPGFEGPSVEAHVLEFQSRICSLLHTAFFLRKNLGEETHKKTLKSQLQRLRRGGSPVPGRAKSPGPGGRTPPRGSSPVPLPPQGYGMQRMPFQHEQPFAQPPPSYAPVQPMGGVIGQNQMHMPRPPPPPPPRAPPAQYGHQQQRYFRQ